LASRRFRPIRDGKFLRMFPARCARLSLPRLARR